ncbi:feruloyl CoA ortho-hydroxylase 1-like protein [Tanacetum coccineum]|uniref:Feruloyl CoA ortho-hydroxylase 1-like protein n=1 Tax=Tanacetum coccineum TaxID=301880 RepID=A0ABQ4XIS0_9ASTR
MDDTGKVHVSGYIEPNVLLKCMQKNGKEAHLVHWQYGECSTNLYQNNSYQNSGFQRGGYQNGGYHQGGYGGYHNNNGNGYSYNHQPLVTYVPSYPPRGDPYASDEESSSWSIIFTPEAAIKALEWKDYPPFFFVSMIESSTLWPSYAGERFMSLRHRVSANGGGSSNRLLPIFVNPMPEYVIGPLQNEYRREKPLFKNVVYSDYVKHIFRKAHDGKATIDFAKV